jgi:F0F1-type ATP synthase membrane subunit b/b'
MATEGPGRAGAPALTSLPRYEDIPRAGEGLDADRVREAFDAFRRHAAQLQAQLRVLQAAGTRPGPSVEPTGHAVRMDALHLIRAAAEFADTIERDAQNASAAQLGKTEEEVRRRQEELQQREADVERYRTESERQRAEMLNAARNEARDLLAKAHADATREVQEAEARGNRMLEQSRHQATELTNAARAEVEQTLEWARAQASAILARAQHGAEQLLAAAGLGEPAIGQVVQSIMAANESEMARSAPTATAPVRPAAAIAGAPPVSPPVSEPPAAETAAEDEPEPEEPEEQPTPPVTPSADAEEAPDEQAEGDAEPER